MKNKVNLFIVGAPRCGTTAWVEYLSAHPDIAFSTPKEPHFFNDDMPGFRWAKTEEEYFGYFFDTMHAKIVGDASVQYLYSQTAAKNIAQFSPDAKILIFLRDQKSFLPSYHHQLLYNGDEQIRDFYLAWEASGNFAKREIPGSCREQKLLDYRAVGRFGEQLQRYVDNFPSDHIMILRFEEWTKDPGAAYLAILKFLELEDDGRTEFEKVHGAHRHRFLWLSRITQRPPGWAKVMSRTIRSIPGLRNFNPVRTLRSLNRAEGYGSSASNDLDEEINEYFRKDSELLKTIISSSGIRTLKD